MPLPRILGELADLLIPSVCLVCADRCAGDLPLCARCQAAMVRAEPGEATVPVAPGEGPTALWVLERDGPVRALVHALKYRGLRRIGPVIGGRIGGRLLRDGQRPFDGVVPLPLHPSRRRERGYNQADLLARGVAERLGAPVLPEILVRRRRGPSQTRGDRDERAAAVRGAFAVPDPSAVSGRRLLLVDDVVTTGSTAAAAAGALTAAGAACVHVAAAALAGSGLQR